MNKERIANMDREKVISGLQELSDYLFHEYKVCYKGDEADCYERFLQANNALELLKEQEAVVRCQDCKYRSFYCTEATDGTTLYECHHPCANSVARPGNWFCAEGERKK